MSIKGCFSDDGGQAAHQMLTGIDDDRLSTEKKCQLSQQIYVDALCIVDQTRETDAITLQVTDSTLHVEFIIWLII